MSNNTNPPASALNWFEIPVRDVNRALPLYSAMLDAKLAPTPYGTHQLVLLGSNGCLIDGIATKTAPGGTIVYLAARDGVRASLARAVEAGAKVVMPETSIGEHGTIAQIEDLDGNVVGLHAEPGK